MKRKVTNSLDGGIAYQYCLNTHVIQSPEDICVTEARRRGTEDIVLSRDPGRPSRWHNVGIKQRDFQQKGYYDVCNDGPHSSSYTKFDPSTVRSATNRKEVRKDDLETRSWIKNRLDISMIVIHLGHHIGVTSLSGMALLGGIIQAQIVKCEVKNIIVPLPGYTKNEKKYRAISCEILKRMRRERSHVTVDIDSQSSILPIFVNIVGEQTIHLLRQFIPHSSTALPQLGQHQFSLGHLALPLSLLPICSHLLRLSTEQHFFLVLCQPKRLP